MQASNGQSNLAQAKLCPLGVFISECIVDLCSMQMPPSKELATDYDDFEDEGVPAPSGKTTRQEKTGKGKGKSRTASSSQPLQVGGGGCNWGGENKRGQKKGESGQNRRASWQKSRASGQK